MGTIAEYLINQGIKKGEARGRRNTLEEVTLRLLDNGLDLQAIENCTGLSHYEIIAIRDKHS